MAFWGVTVKPKKEAAFVPPPEESKLHLSQACLAPGTKAGARATLLVCVGGGDPLAVCSLREGTAEGCSLDLVLDQYTEFSVAGGAEVHLTGYFMPDYEIQGGMESEEEDEEGAAIANGTLLGYDEFGVPILAEEYDSEDDSDYEDGEGPPGFYPGEEDEEDSEGSDEEDSEDEYDSAEELLLSGRKSNVTIEDITDRETDKEEGAPAGKAGRKALPSSENGKAAAYADDDVSGSDEGSSGSEEESEEEEELPVRAARKGAKQAVNGKDAAGQKRKADAAAAAAPPAKKDKPEAAAAKKKEAAAKPKAKDAGKVEAASPAANEVPSGKKHVKRYANGFEVEDVAQGRADGKLAKPGKRVAVRYVGRLKNGKVFDQTTGAKTFSFRLGVGEVIKGWDRGVEGMRVGDKRRLTVPPAMGYGGARTGPIPPNSTLLFDVELVDVKG